jgi:hypothetical protein
MIRSVSKPMATPGRISIQTQNPDSPRDVLMKKINGKQSIASAHTSHS